jgi:hypothetical protein
MEVRRTVVQLVTECLKEYLLKYLLWIATHMNRARKRKFNIGSRFIHHEFVSFGTNPHATTRSGALRSMANRNFTGSLAYRITYNR